MKRTSRRTVLLKGGDMKRTSRRTVLLKGGEMKRTSRETALLKSRNTAAIKASKRSRYWNYPHCAEVYRIQSSADTAY